MNFIESGIANTKNANLIIAEPGRGAFASLDQMTHDVARAQGKRLVDINQGKPLGLSRNDIILMKINQIPQDGGFDIQEKVGILEAAPNAILLLDVRGGSEDDIETAMAICDERRLGGADLDHVAIFVVATPLDLVRNPNAFNDALTSYILDEPREHLIDAVNRRRSESAPEPAQGNTPKAGK